jgi:exosortase
LVLLSFGLLWFILINQLRVEWTVNPQYSYGWVVPFLCLGLLLRRWQSMLEEVRSQKSEVSCRQPSDLRPPTSDLWFVALFATTAFLLLPLRLILEANPNWPTPQWLLACIVIALTLMAVWRSLGPGWTRHLAFPICFILIAVAWPPSIEIPLIQGLTRANVATTIECVGWLGIPAAQHGNVIEVGTGMVGVNEACSGIRSFQTSIMISLFMGEFYRLSLRRRLLLLPAGFIAAFFFNVCRTTLLVLVASKKGIAAIESWHDPAGVTITIACTLVLWLVAALLFNKKLKTETLKTEIGNKASAVSGQLSVVSRPVTPDLRPLTSRLFPLSLALLVWLIAVQVGVELWYRSHESRSAKTPEWTLNWPPRESTFQERPVPAITWEMLKYQEGHCGVWLSEGNLEYEMNYFRWSPGKIAVTSARGHTPDVCLTAAGKTLRQIDDNRSPITIGSLVFPFRRYEFDENGRVCYVFYCLWEDHAPGGYFDRDAGLGPKDPRLQNVIQGRRNLGQRSMEIMLSGAEDAKSAQAAVASELQKLIKVRSSPSV